MQAKIRKRGIPLQINTTSDVINFLHPNGSVRSFHYPHPVDVLMISSDDILTTGLQPTMAKKYFPILSPILSKLANFSFSTGVFPSTFKSAQVLPLLKKPSLDPSSPANYRPISNLSTMSSLLERLILPRIRPHITNSSNFSPLQSAYRPGFSIETALSHIFNNLSNICGNCNSAVMVGLDLSAAFDTINHRILLDRLHSDFGIDGLALSWLRSYLSNRSQYVNLGDHTSFSSALLGPLLFTTYTSPLSDIVKNFDVCFHQ